MRPVLLWASVDDVIEGSCGGARLDGSGLWRLGFLVGGVFLALVGVGLLDAFLSLWRVNVGSDFLL